MPWRRVDQLSLIMVPFPRRTTDASLEEDEELLSDVDDSTGCGGTGSVLAGCSVPLVSVLEPLRTIIVALPRRVVSSDVELLLLEVVLTG